MRLNEFMKIGDNFKRIRTDRNLTQAEMANLLSLPRSTYANYEANKRTPSSEELERIAFDLYVPLKTLLGIESKPNLFIEKNSSEYKLTEMIKEDSASTKEGLVNKVIEDYKLEK